MWYLITNVSLTRRLFKNQFSHWQARCFLLLRQNKVSKENATRMPLASCARAVPDKNASALRGIREFDASLQTEDIGLTQ